MTRLPLQPYQVHAALEKRLSIVTMNVRPQPRASGADWWIWDGHGMGLDSLKDVMTGMSPFPYPGKTFVGTEPFTDTGDDFDLIKPIFRANGLEYEDGNGFLWEPKWKSSAVMPSKYSRFLFTVVRRGVWRLGDVTAQDAYSMGFKIEGIHNQSLTHQWETMLSLFHKEEERRSGVYNPDHWQFYAEVSVEVRRS